MPDRGRDVGIGQPGKSLASGPAGGDGGQALLHVAAVPVEMRRRESFEQGSVRRIQVPERHQMFGQGP